MTAFGFKRRFIEPIRLNIKRQTVRRIRKDGRTAHVGAELQLYYAMRTRQCTLIGRSICTSCRPIQLWLSLEQPRVHLFGLGPNAITDDVLLNPHIFARDDGFASWADLVAFWEAEHPGVHHFAGTLTTWGDLL